MYTNPNKFIQFELWKDCKLGCRFCCNKGQPKTDKIKSLEMIISLLKNPKIMEGYNEIGFIGGEIFNDELSDKKVCAKFYEMINCLKSLKMDKIYIATSLMYDMDKYLIQFLNYMNENQLLNKCWICTSFDVAFRFKSLEQKELWKNNMLELTQKFPSLHKHVEMIITEHCINAILKNELNLSYFQKDYNAKVDFIEPSSGLYYDDKKDCEKDCPGFFPKKSSFIKFLKKVKNEINLETLLSMELRSNKLYYYYNNDYKLVDDRRSGDGRCELNGKKYEIGFIDSDIPMREVVKQFIELNKD